MNVSSAPEQGRYTCSVNLPSFPIFSPTHAREGFAIFLETAIPESPNLHVHKERVPLKWSGGMKEL